MGDFRGYGDAELVMLTLDGNVDAYGELVVRYQKTVFAVIAGIVSEHSTVEDIAQETFIDGFMQLPQLRETEKFVPWLAGIARRRALHYVTRRRFHTDIDEVTIVSHEDDPELGFILEEERQAVRAAVESLPEGQRRAAEMFYFDNLSITEIAHRLSVPPGTVKRRLHDARQKLKERLGHMNDKKKTTAADFAAEVKRKIDEIKMYYIESGFARDDKLTAMFDEAERFITEESDEKTRSSALAELYTKSWSASEEKKGLIRELAEKGENGNIIADVMINELLNTGDHKEWIRRIDEEYLPAIEHLDCDEGKGELIFWRGRAKLEDKYPIDEVLADFENAVKLIPPSEVYHAAAVTAVKSINFMREHAEDVYTGINVTAEGYRKRGTKMIFVNQPGFSSVSVMHSLHRFDYINYFASCCGRTFFDTSMKVGDTFTSGDGTLTVVSSDETVLVPAGEFTNCLHIAVKEKDGVPDDVWYADGVGIVKAVYRDESTEETYELSEYEIKGGDGYFPFAIGNRWRYVNRELPEYLAYIFENEMTWTDGVSANMSVMHSVTFKKGYLTSGSLDSDYYIGRCDTLCSEGKTAEAMDALAAAIRKNTRERATLAAVAGMEYLERFYEYEKRGYRLCPSHYGASNIILEDGRIKYDESGECDFGPYRFGGRYEENRIYGVKPLRYLQESFGCVWDEKWVPGYHEEEKNSQRMDEEHPFSFKVEDGGSVTVPAGTFDNCIKLTLMYGVPGDVKLESFTFASQYIGKKEYWFARGVGIVRFDSDWFGELRSSCELVSYKNPSRDDAYLPVALGCEWEYDEAKLTAEGYRAKLIMKIACGMNGRFMMHDQQEFIYLGTEEEYEAFKARLAEAKA